MGSSGRGFGSLGGNDGKMRVSGTDYRWIMYSIHTSMVIARSRWRNVGVERYSVAR
jgi:hypothetical protein